MPEKKRPTKAQAAYYGPEKQAQEYLEECELARHLQMSATVELTFKDLMMILTGAMTPFIRQLNQLTKDMEELKEITVRYADEVRKLRKKRH